MVKKSIDRDELFRYYITENHSVDECAEYFMVHNRTIRRRISEYGIRKPIELQTEAWRNTHVKRYGDIFVQSQFYRENIKEQMVSKSRKTCMERYGVPSAASLDSTKAKSIETFMNKYGAEHYTQTLDYHRKSRRFYYYDGEMFDSS